MSYFETIYASELPARAVNVYRYLGERADRQGRCFPSIRTIAGDLHLSTSTVKRALRDLERSGFLSWENRLRMRDGRSYGKSSNLYTVLCLTKAGMEGKP